MATLQQQILTAYAATLVAAGTAAGARVYVDHPDELTPEMLPAIVLEAGAENVQTIGLNPPQPQERAWQLDIIAVTRGAGAAAAARELGGQIEAALHSSLSDQTAGGIVKTLALQSANPQLNGSTTQIVAEMRQNWLITYHTRAGTPGASA